MKRIDGTYGADLVTDRSITSPKIALGAVLPEHLSQKLTLMTAVDLTTLSDKTKCDFTGIPIWAKRITVMLSGVSTNGTSHYLLQLGAGAIQTTGYLSGSYNGSVVSASSGMVIVAGGASVVMLGHIVFTPVQNNQWVSSHSTGRTDGIGACGGGVVSLSGVLDRIRVTAVNGTDLFDAGSVNIMYEG